MMVKRRKCENVDCPVVEYRTVIHLLTNPKINQACPACGKVGRAVG